MAVAPGANRSSSRVALAVAGAVIVRPRLWGTAIRQGILLAPRGWWRRRPFLPLPDGDYLAFRMQTAYGSSGATPQAADIVGYLTWCRAWPRVTQRSH
jgi:hypothetical protein